MKILVINAGSSSLKYQLFNMQTGEVLAKGLCERIGTEGNITHKRPGKDPYKENVPFPTHDEALAEVIRLLTDDEFGVIASVDEIDAVGHRIAHGGKYQESVVIDDEVIHYLETIIPINPLHGPPAIKGMNGCRHLMPGKLQVGVFDTAFYAHMPPEAYIYALPYELYTEKGIRRYGFHGTSHRYVSHRCAELMGQDLKDLKMITCHLGNGSSISAIQDGKVIDTSMGLTPLDGFMMGSRTGTLDPSVVTFVMEKENITPHDMSEMLNKKSGMLGISGVSSDDRDVTKAAREGNPRAILAHEMLEYEITKFIGAYAAALNGCDVIVFTAGLGENQAHHRQVIGDGLTYLGVKIDPQLNEEMIRGKEGLISTPDSKVKVYVIPTNEELVIARDTKEIVEAL